MRTLFRLGIALCLLMGFAASSFAQNWTSAVNGNWSDGANWSSNPNPPTSGTTTTLSFPNPFATAYTATNDIAGTFTLNAITLTNFSSAAIVIDNAAGSSLSFGGTNPAITSNGPGPATISGTSIDLPGSVLLAGAGDGPLTIASQITGVSGSLVINRPTTNLIGLTAVTPTTASTFAGGSLFQAGHLSVNATSGLGAGLFTIDTTGAGLSSTGDLRASATATIANSVQINSGRTLNVFTGAALTLSGGINGPGGLQLGDGISANITTGLALTGTNGYTGATNINNGTLLLTGNSPNGAISGTSALTIGRLGLLTLGSTTTLNNDRIPNGLAISLNGGGIRVISNTTAGNNVNEDFGAVTFQGFASLTTDAQTNSSAAMTIANLVRSNRGTVLVRGDSLGNGPIPTNNTGNVILTQINGGSPAAALVGGGGGAGTTNRSILPFAVGSSTVAGNGDSFVTYDSTNGIVPLNTSTEVIPVVVPLIYSSVASNYRLTTPSPGVNLMTAVNSIAVVTAAGGIYGLGGAAPGVLVSSGAVMGNSVAQLPGMFFNTREAVVTAVSNAVTFNGALNGSNGITFSLSGTAAAPGEVILTTASLNLTGPITINGSGGQLIITNQLQLGTSSTVTLNGAGLSFRGWTDTLSQNLVVGPLGGALQAQTIGGSNSATGSARSTTLNYAGSLSGNGSFYINGFGDGTAKGGGTTTLSGNNSGFSGVMTLANGITVVDSEARFGTGPRLQMGNITAGATTTSASLRATMSIPINRPITLIGSATTPGPVEFITPSGVTLTLNGLVNANSAVPLVKVGPGTLTMTNAVSHAGTTTIGGATTRAEPGGILTLTNQGALTRTSAVNINEGSTLILDNQTTNSNNRVLDVNVTLAGGTLSLLGNGGALTAEGLGQLIIPAHAGGIVNVSAFSPGSPTPRFTFSAGGTTSPLSRGAGSTIVFQANGVIGNAPVGQSEFRFINPTGATPALLNSVLVGAFGQDSSGGGLVTLNTQGPGVVNVRPLIPADAGNFGVQLTFAGANSASNVLVVSPQPAMNSVTDTNAISIGPGITQTVNASLSMTSGSLVLGPSANVNGPGPIFAGPGQDLSIFTPGSAINTASVSTALIAVGSTTLSKTGGATLALNADVSQFTTINIHSGQVTLGASAVIGNLSALNVQSGATLLGTNFNLNVDALGGTGTVSLGNGILNIGISNGNSNFGGTLSASSLFKNGTGTLRFTQNANYAGPIEVTGGILAFGENSPIAPTWPAVIGGTITFNGGTALFVNGPVSFSRNVVINSGTVELDNGGQGGATTFTNSFTIAAGAILNVDTTTSGGFRLNGPITGDGVLNLGAGISLLNGNNNHTGGSTLNSATAMLLIGHNSALGTGPFTVAAAGFVMPFGGNRSLANTVSLNANVTFGPAAGDETISNAFNLTFNGATTLGGAAGSRTVTVTGSGNFTLTSVVDGSATGITKAGGGSLTLAGTSTYSGTTAINAGSLIVAGSKTGPGVVTVGNTAATGAVGVLAGGGSVAGAITVQNTGVVAPGASAGILTTPGGVSFNAGGTYFWELTADSTSSPGTNWDRIDATGAIVNIAAGSRLVPAFMGTSTIPNSGQPFWQTMQTWQDVILTNSATGATGFVIDNSVWISAGSFGTIASPGGGVSIVWTPVPEPIHGLLAIVGCAALVRWGRRRFRGHHAERA